MKFDPNIINSLMRARRSTFVPQFEPGKRIEDHIIWQLLENANRSPNHGHTEPWRFSVFCDGGLQKLADFQSELYKKEAGDKFKNEKFEKLKSNPLKCSHIISIGMHKSEGAKIPELEEIEAVACAVENMYLTIAAYEVGGYWTTGGVTYFDSAKEFFGLGEKDKLLGFFYVGHIAVPSPMSKRFPVQEKVKWNAY